MNDKKKIIEEVAEEFKKATAADKMFILGYMLGVQKEKEHAA